MSISAEIALIRITPDGCCSYCHRAFGSWVTWKRKRRFLSEVREHVYPKCLGGRITIPSCSLCNQIKGSMVFESLSEIQDFLLNRLTRGRSIILSYGRQIQTNREVRVESITDLDLQEFKVDQLVVDDLTVQEPVDQEPVDQEPVDQEPVDREDDPSTKVYAPYRLRLPARTRAKPHYYQWCPLCGQFSHKPIDCPSNPWKGSA